MLRSTLYEYNYLHSFERIHAHKTSIERITEGVYCSPDGTVNNANVRWSLWSADLFFDFTGVLAEVIVCRINLLFRMFLTNSGAVYTRGEQVLPFITCLYRQQR